MQKSDLFEQRRIQMRGSKSGDLGDRDRTAHLGSAKCVSQMHYLNVRSLT